MKKELKKKKVENILVFGAHSDDQILGPGGTLAKYSKQGKRVYTIIFSYGEGSHPWLKKHIAADTRFKEAKEANRIIGGSGIRVLGLSEGKFEDEAEKALETIKELIKKFRPSKIFTHSVDDPHGDHRAVVRIILDAVDEINFKGDVLSFDIWNPLTFRGRDKPRLYVDITETFATKLEALKCFRSQWFALTFLMWSVYARAFINGFHTESRYAERFYKVR